MNPKSQIRLRDSNLLRLRDAARAGASIQSGWLNDAFDYLGRERVFVMALTPGVVVTMLGTMPINSLYNDKNELIDACNNVTQGSSLKATATALMPGAGANLTQALTPAATRSFGVIAQLGDSLNSFKAGGYPIQLQDGATALYQVLVQVPPCVNSFSLLLLSAANNAGLASIVPLVEPTVVITGSAAGSATVSSTTSVILQSLNQRDIGSRSSLSR